jgi:hypothetical protein
MYYPVSPKAAFERGGRAGRRVRAPRIFHNAGKSGAPSTNMVVWMSLGMPRATQVGSSRRGCPFCTQWRPSRQQGTRQSFPVGGSSVPSGLRYRRRDARPAAAHPRQARDDQIFHHARSSTRAGAKLAIRSNACSSNRAGIAKWRGRLAERLPWAWRMPDLMERGSGKRVTRGQQRAGPSVLMTARKMAVHHQVGPAGPQNRRIVGCVAICSESSLPEICRRPRPD